MASADVQPERRVSLAAVEEEIANSISHGFGLVLSLGALFGLVIVTVLRGSVWHIIGCTVYGVSLVSVYLASTLYHGVRRPRLKQLLRKLDHVAIFLLIAGTYTPFTLVNLRGPWGWTLFVLVWGLAVAGTVMKLAWPRHPEALSLTVYLAMGWVGIVAAKPIIETLPIGALLWLFAGGMAYTIGTIFYVLDARPYFHTIWHLFVILGSLLHFVAIVLYVVPIATSG